MTNRVSPHLRPGGCKTRHRSRDYNDQSGQSTLPHLALAHRILSRIFTCDFPTRIIHTYHPTAAVYCCCRVFWSKDDCCFKFLFKFLILPSWLLPEVIIWLLCLNHQTPIMGGIDTMTTVEMRRETEADVRNSFNRLQISEHYSSPTRCDAVCGGFCFLLLLLYVLLAEKWQREYYYPLM